MSRGVLLAVLGLLLVVAGGVLLDRAGDQRLSQLARGALREPADETFVGWGLLAVGTAFLLAASPFAPGWWGT